MKITKNRLKQILKEEIQTTLSERVISDPKEQKEKAQQLYQKIDGTLSKYGQEFRSPNQIADAIIYAASKKGITDLGEPAMPSKENKFDGTRNAATVLYNFMEEKEPKLVLTVLFKAFVYIKGNKKDMIQYGKDRSSRESAAFSKFSQAGGSVKDLNKPKRRKFLTRSVELVNEEQ